MNRLHKGLGAAVIGVAAAAMLPSTPALATVSTTPASWTPQVISSNAIVRQLVQCGSTMYAVGSFTTIKQGNSTYTRNNAFSFSATTGAVTSWNPNVSGTTVESVALSPNCGTVYLGGKFTQIGSTAVKNIAAVSPSTGQVIASFKHSASGMVRSLLMVNGGTQLLTGGNFTGISGSSTPYYASLNPSTGSVTPYLQATVAGLLAGSTGSTMVYNQQLSSQGDRALFEGNFTSISGQPRQQVAELDLTSTSATLDAFSNQTLNSTSCTSSEVFYGRAAAFSPDEKTVYLATTGYKGSSPFCDAVVAFTNTANSSVRWENKTGGDSLYAVAAGPSDVYIGGHERWANNPYGLDSCGQGCVSRPGVGDISDSTGLATSWNPTRSRGKGADDLVITPAGLWIASDNWYSSTQCGGQYHPGICFFPGTA